MNQLSIQTSEASKASTAMSKPYNNLNALLAYPFHIGTTEAGTDPETGELDGWVEEFEGIDEEGVIAYVNSGWFELATSSDGEIHLWPDYSRYDSFPEGMKWFRDMCHGGLVLNFFPDNDTEH